jgi:hypothetical protein
MTSVVAVVVVLLLATAPALAAPLLNHIGFANGIAALACKDSLEGSHYVIIDADDSGDCDSTGGGTIFADCKCHNGVYAAETVGGSGNSFETVDTPAGTNPVADGPNDTITYTCAPPLSCTGDSTTDTVALAADATIIPTDISGLVIWLDPTQDDANYNDGDAVGTAANYGSGGNFTQSTGSKKFTFKTGVLNGHPVYRLDGGDCEVSASTIGISTFDAFVVFKATAHGFIYEQSAASDANDGSSLYTDFAQARVRRTQISQRGTNPTGYGGNDSQWRVMAQEYAGTHETHRLWIDGAYVFTQDTTGDGPTASTSTITATVNVGCRNNGSFFLTGDIAEFLVYTPKLSSYNVDRVKTYLRYKYGL